MTKKATNKTAKPIRESVISDYQRLQAERGEMLKTLRDIANANHYDPSVRLRAAELFLSITA